MNTEHAKTSVITDQNGSVLTEATAPFRLVPSDTYGV